MSIDPRHASDWVFVIDTENYAGNFEREMTAHITGAVGECGVGQQAADLALKELPKTARDWFDAHVVQISDENGCGRPTSIWPTPGWWNNGMGGHFKDDHDETDARASHDKAVRDYAENTIAKTYGDKAYGRKEADRFLKDTLPKPGVPLQRFPAFQSVAIFLDAKPPSKIIDLIRERAKSCKPLWDTTPTITGFRLLKTQPRKFKDIPI